MAVVVVRSLHVTAVEKETMKVSLHFSYIAQFCTL